jgi:predicted Zn-dependent protease
VLAGLLWGDVSSLAANVPAVIGVLSYSREEEREADAFAAKVLADNGLGAEPLIEVFEMFAHKHEKCGCGLPEFLSSHPSTSERIETLRNALPARP